MGFLDDSDGNELPFTVEQVPARGQDAYMLKDKDKELFILYHTPNTDYVYGLVINNECINLGRAGRRLWDKLDTMYKEQKAKQSNAPKREAVNWLFRQLNAARNME